MVLVFFIIAVPLLGYVLLRTAEFVQKVWKGNNRKKKWVAMCFIAAIYLVLQWVLL